MKKLYCFYETLHNAPHLIWMIWALNKEDAETMFKEEIPDFPREYKIEEVKSTSAAWFSEMTNKF